MTTVNKIETLKALFASAAQNEAQAKEVAKSKRESATNVEEQNEFLKLEKRAATHEKYNAALSDMSEKALALLSKYKVDAQALSEQSRELKKRSIAMLEAIAHSKRVDDTALDALLHRLAAKRDASMTLDAIRREMTHKTETQASYFKTCASFFKFAQYSKSDKTVNFDYESAFLKALIALYA